MPTSFPIKLAAIMVAIVQSVSSFGQPSPAFKINGIGLGMTQPQIVQSTGRSVRAEDGWQLAVGQTTKVLFVGGRSKVVCGSKLSKDSKVVDGSSHRLLVKQLGNPSKLLVFQGTTYWSYPRHSLLIKMADKERGANEYMLGSLDPARFLEPPRDFLSLP
jgi:hypothetical protein